MALSQIDAEQGIERLSYIKLQSIGGVPLLDPWWRQGRLECGSIGTQLRQCALNLLVAFGDLNLVKGVEPTLVSPAAKFVMQGPSERSCRGQNGRRGSRGFRSTASQAA